MENRKIILRAIASTIRLYEKESLAIAKKYDYNLSKNPTTEELVNSIVISFINGNEAFIIEFFNLMSIKDEIKTLSDFNNFDPISLAVSSGTALIGGFLNMKAQTQSAEIMAEAQENSATYMYGAEVQGTTQELLELMQTENNLQGQKTNSETAIIITVVLIASFITAMILHKKL